MTKVVKFLVVHIHKEGFENPSSYTCLSIEDTLFYHTKSFCSDPITFRSLFAAKTWKLISFCQFRHDAVDIMNILFHRVGLQFALNIAVLKRFCTLKQSNLFAVTCFRMFFFQRNSSKNGVSSFTFSRISIF